MRFRKKTNEIEAVLWEGGAESGALAVEWINAQGGQRAAYVPAGDAMEPVRPEAIFLESTISGAMSIPAPAYFYPKAEGGVAVIAAASPDEFLAQFEQVVG